MSARHIAMASWMASRAQPVLCRHGEGIDLPAGGDHCVLEVGQVPAGNFRASGARPLA